MAKFKRTRLWLAGHTMVIAALLPAVAAAQQRSETQFRKELSPLLQKIQQADYGSAEAVDNIALFVYLRAACEEHPELLRYDFEGIDTLGLFIETSADRKLRFYHWDQSNGGTMHFFAGMAQYETSPGRTAVYTLSDSAGLAEGGDSGEWYDDLQTLQTVSGKTVYVVMHGSIGSSVDHTIGIQALTIQNGRLNWEPPFFHTKTKQYNDISYYYSLLETKEFGQNDIPTITLSADKKTLTIPVVTEEGRITRGKLVYRFDGEKFVFVK